MSGKALFSYYLGIGSNIGNRNANLIQCLKNLKSIGNIKETSYLYESYPMYYEQQSSFLNAAVHIQSSINPLNLLKKIKNIEENIMNREINFRNGPRIIDIDILCGFDENSKEIYYDSNDDDLIIPHPRISERNFVLTPLNDILPNYKFDNKPINKISQSLIESDKKQHNLFQVLPLKTFDKIDNELFYKIDNSDHSLLHKTLLMGILNITPDSFSDGGKWINKMDKLLSFLDDEINVKKTNIDIIDIGAQSTRPNAKIIPIQQELDRILPVLQSINHHFGESLNKNNISISIDTFNSKVAKECVLNGNANIINDVSSGTFDDKMYSTIYDLGVPFICMHLRGNPSTMQNIKNLTYGHNQNDNHQFISILRNELFDKIEKAKSFGIPSWNIIIDPGIGFAKNSKHNQYLLNNMNKLNNNFTKYPILSGCSRKSFLNSIFDQDIIKKGTDSMEKIIGTQCAVTSSILSGANIVRVHDFYTMDIVRRVSDSFFNVNQCRNVIRDDIERTQPNLK